MEDADWAIYYTHTSPRNQYQYEPLITEGVAVRILNLYPGNDFQSPLSGFITHHELEAESLDPDGCSYSAVSYAWGDATFSHQLLIRVGAGWNLLAITRNADLLLRHLRDAHRETQFWIDSVCINQNDQAEKARQIPLMGQIYSHAKRVHIWLGHDEIEDAQRAFSLLRRIEKTRTFSTTVYSPERDEWLCLEKFFNRPWFRRRWVVQEVFFSHDAIFHSGYHRLSYSRVRAALGILQLSQSTHPPGYGVSVLISIGAGLQERRGLLDLLWGLHESDCSDERDRIAALYALVHKSKRPPLLYDAGWKKLYTEVASHYLNSAYSMAYMILHHLCGFGPIKPSVDDEVPSWVPNWTTRRRRQVSLHAWQSPLCREYPLSAPQVNVPFRFTPLGAIPESEGPSRWEQWRQAEKRYEEYLGGDNPHGLPTILSVAGDRLRIKYDFLTFIYGCGSVEHIIYPSSSAQFWEEFVGLFKGREQYFTRSKVASKGPRDKRQQLEAVSLSAILIGVLLGASPPLEDYQQSALSLHVGKLCANLCSGYTYTGELEAPTERQREYLHKIGSALSGSALLRVQTASGYYWAIGQVNSVEGDWLVPIIPSDDKSRYPHLLYTAQDTTQFICLRPVGTGAQAKAWYSSPTTDLERRLHRLVGFMKTGVDPAPISVRFAGSGQCSKYAFDHNLSYDTAMWDIFMKAADTAKGRSRPLSVSFDVS